MSASADAPVLFEGCADSVASARAAVAAGAGRLELCVRLDVGGLTPPDALLRDVVGEFAIPVHAMVRPRSGPFVAGATVVAEMEDAIARCARLGAAGVVLGLLDGDARVDRAAVERLVRAARPLTVTFHRAFDGTRDRDEALETLVALGVDRVLSSGGAPSAEEGIDALRDLVLRARGRIGIIAGGGVRPHNWRRIVAETGVREIHGTVPIPMPRPGGA